MSRHQTANQIFAVMSPNHTEPKPAPQPKPNPYNEFGELGESDNSA